MRRSSYDVLGCYNAFSHWLYLINNDIFCSRLQQASDIFTLISNCCGVSGGSRNFGTGTKILRGAFHQKEGLRLLEKSQQI